MIHTPRISASKMWSRIYDHALCDRRAVVHDTRRNREARLAQCAAEGGHAGDAGQGEAHVFDQLAVEDDQEETGNGHAHLSSEFGRERREWGELASLRLLRPALRIPGQRIFRDQTC